MRGRGTPIYPHLQNLPPVNLIGNCWVPRAWTFPLSNPRQPAATRMHWSQRHSLNGCPGPEKNHRFRCHFTSAKKTTVDFHDFTSGDVKWFRYQNAFAEEIPTVNVRYTGASPKLSIPPCRVTDDIGLQFQIFKPVQQPQGFLWQLHVFVGQPPVFPQIKIIMCHHVSIILSV